MAFTGIGAAYAFNPLGDQVYAADAENFTFTENPNFQRNKAHSKTTCSTLLDRQLTKLESEFTLTLTVAVINELGWDFVLFDNERGTAASFARPRLVSKVVGATTPNQIDVPGMTVDRPTTSVIILGTAAPGDVRLDFQADGTGLTATTYENNAGFVEVDPVWNGRTASVIYFEDPASVPNVIGGPLGDNQFTNLSFFGRICGPEFNDKILYIPAMTSLTGAQFDPKAENFPREYACFTTPEFPIPYAVFDAL